MPEYIDLDFAKKYLSFINTDSFEVKLQMIIDGVNQKIAKGTDNSEPDAELKLFSSPMGRVSMVKDTWSRKAKGE